MTVATKVKSYLNENGIEYDVVTHPHTTSSLQTAESAHVSGHRIAKGVVLKDDDGYLLAVLPASRELDLHRLENQIGRRMELAAEQELRNLFPDCQLGAVPALGPSYDLKSIIDEALLSEPEIYFEAGSHEELIHLSESQFEKVMEGAERHQFSRPHD